MLFGAAYYPEHRPETDWNQDLDNLAAMGANAVRLGEFAWIRFEPADGRYDFNWTDRFLEAAWKRKIGVMLCPPLRTIPAWLRDQADLRIVADNGLALEYGARYTFCINQPLLRSKGYAPELSVSASKVAQVDCHVFGVCRERFTGRAEGRRGRCVFCRGAGVGGR